MPDSPNENRLELSRFRLEQAQQCLDSARVLTASGDFKAAANRSYYCIFHAMRAVLALDGFDAKKHSGIIAKFRQDYIKTGSFPAEYSAIIKDAFSIRGDSDYEDFFVISRAEVGQQLQNAEVFLKAVEKYLKSDK